MEKITVREYPKYITECPGITDPIDKSMFSTSKNTDAMDKRDKKLEDKIFSMTGRASTGLLNACAEWMLYRVDAASVYPNICQYVEAYWLRILNIGYIKHWERKWMVTSEKGAPPVIGDIGMDLFGISNGGHTIPPLNTAVSFIKLTRYVVQNNKVFDKWFKQVMKRLMTLYPRTVEYGRYKDVIDYNFFRTDPGYLAYKECLNGPAVPREAYDPDFDFKIEMTEELISKMLDEMKTSGNIYLKSPEEMISEGFKGTPYVWKV